MDAFGINIGFLIIQLCVVAAIFALPVAAILQLRKRYFPNDTEKLIWVIIIVIAPIIGALSFFIIRPGKDLDS